MFFNKPINISISNKIYFRTNINIPFLEIYGSPGSTTNNRQICRLYNAIISNIDKNFQYDRYYFVTINLAFREKHHTNYIDALHEFVDNMNNNNSIISDLCANNALLIFDFSSELIPISIDSTTLYGKINKIFQDNKCASNVKYWSMYENPFDIIDKKNCKVDIIPISITALRYVEFDYEKYKKLIYKNNISRKSALYLNGRNRPHRLKLLVECIKNNVNIDNMHFSYVNYDKAFGYNHLIDQALGTNIKSERDKIINKYFGKQILPGKTSKQSSKIYKNINESISNQDIFDWLSSSSIERVWELLNHRAKSKFEIIAEYTFEDIGISISEKLSLTILSKIPFVVLGDRGYMSHLKDLGFKTFDSFWDESYDHDICDKRISKLAITIANIQKDFKCNIDEHGNYKYTDKMTEILEHNYSHYKNVYAPQLQNKILKSLAKS